MNSEFSHKKAQDSQSCLMLFGAHADDIELQAAGTLARLMAKGYEAVYIMVTDNCSGHLLDQNGKAYCLGPQETQSIRHKETEDAVGIFGLKPVYLNFKQRHLWDAKNEKEVCLGSEEYNRLSLSSSREPILIAPDLPPCVKDVTSLIVKYKPGIVLTHGLDIDPEHRSVCSLVFKAFKEAMKEVELGSLYGWGPSSGGEIIEIPPDTFVDISDYMDMKHESFLKHKSQATQKRKDLIMERASFLGNKIGVKYAEGFRTIINGGFGIDI